MITPLTDEEIEAVQSLIERSTLSSVEYHEVSARVDDSVDDSRTEADVDLQIQRRMDSESFGFRLRGQIATQTGEAAVTVAVNYGYEGEQPSERVLLAFGNEVAVMALFPYFREATSMITGKVLGDPILLPLLSRGQLGFDLSLVED